MMSRIRMTELHQEGPIRVIKLSLLCLLIADCQHLTQAAIEPKSSTITQHLTQPSTQTQTHTDPRLNSPPLNVVNSNSHLQLQYTDAGRVQIPGLYDDLTGDIQPIQGQAQFNRLILGLGDDDHKPILDGHAGECRSNLTNEQEAIRRAARRETISLVQFYMASCPDCQGFSPYFKRFSSDIAPHWRKLVQIYTVNCNDFLNIHLCQEQNPKLIVPLVRWYVFPSIQRDSIMRGGHSNQASTTTSSFNYSPDLLNVAHRQFIHKQRRDLISLRQATLRFIALTLDELTNDSQKLKLRHRLQESHPQTFSPKRLFYESLPAAWHHLGQLGRNQPDDLEPKEQFLLDLNERISTCSKAMIKSECGASSGSSNTSSKPTQELIVKNFLVFEDRRSFIGRTLVGDWSNVTCGLLMNQPNAKQTIMVHRSTDLSLLTGTKALAQTSETLAKPILMAFDVTTKARHNSTSPSSSKDNYIRSMDELQFKVLAWNGTQGQSKNNHRARRAAQRPRPERVQQRALLEEYYSRLSGGSKVIQPIRYAAAMSSIGNQNSHILHKRDAQQGHQAKPVDPEQRLRLQADLENVNWVPELVHPSEERLRYIFNERISEELGTNWSLPTRAGFLLGGKNPDEIPKKETSRVSVIEPTADDLSLMFLTDYYRALDEIVHIDLLSKGDADGYQLLASCCFLRDLERHFPFQGNALGSHEIGSKSIARHYVQLLQRAWLDELRARLGSKKLDIGNVSSNNNKPTRSVVPTLESMLQRMHERDGCDRLAESILSWTTSSQQSSGNSSLVGITANRTTIGLDKVHVPSRELEQIQLKIKRAHEVGLPPERHLKWKYCAGSETYLRGHTCSLWILFHTLTVHEYLVFVDTNYGSPSLHQPNTNNSLSSAHSSQPIEYKFQVDYSKPPKRSCDPSNPDGAYLASKTSDLFVGQTKFALANIINFVRYYLPCTNCAAHFSCMVEHSTGLNFDPEYRQAWPDAHLLWLWEAHNRVNERTRGTHSEDPIRPKHIFPSFGACPQCYIEKPGRDTPFLSMRFNRAELVKFLVARYRKSAILNNQINIEDLYRKP